MQNIIVTIVRVIQKLVDWSDDQWDTLKSWIEQVWDASMDVVDMVGVFWMDFVGYFWSFWLDIFTFLTDFALNVLDFSVNFWLAVFVFLANVLADVLLVPLELGVRLLPNMPEAVDSFSVASQANVYLPLVEAAALTAAWGSVFGLIGAYKLAKFVRGGG